MVQMVRIDDVIDSYLQQRPDGDISRIQRAYIYSARQHEGQMRKSGEPYMIHPMGVAQIIADMGLDEAAICAALLHDTVEDTETTCEKLKEIFGEDVALLVDGVTKLSGVNFTKREERQAESFRKLLVAMASDIRVLLVKLADRLHNMRTLEFMKESARLRIAQETRDIYAPLADRLGISWLKSNLDDISFRFLEPNAYADLVARVDKLGKVRQQYIQRTIREMRELLKVSGFETSVSGRLKNLFSIYQKMHEKGLAYEEVHDAIAFRVICKSIPDCYAILGIVHSKWLPIPGRFKDYIAMPKPNHYRSLHTTVISKSGERVEIQIRTDEMHRVAEYGIAAHWGYKEGQPPSPSSDGFTWLRELLESQTELRDSEEFLDSVKVDLFRDEVFVFTPQGDVKALPRGATPIDFAYTVHTEVGHQCAGARVNGLQVSLKARLKNGDMVEIVTSKNQRPSPDWLDIVASSRARNKIRAFLRTEQREQSRQVGQDLLEKALRKYSRSYAKMMKTGVLAEVASSMRFGSAEDLVAAVGYGKVDRQEVVRRLLPDEDHEKTRPDAKEGPISKVIRKVTRQDEGITLDGLDNLLVKFARCCNALPGEEIVGYVSRGRGVVIHRRNCQRAALLDPERRTKVHWSAKAVSQRPVKLKVLTTNRAGILAALSTIFQSHDISISSANCQASSRDQGINIFSFSVNDLGQLNRLVRSLMQAKHVIDVQRMHS
jgi:GTP diphosphokinase / guanosine-3',5'-bis(diphosphate) 3'-diphosphatase